MTEFQHSVKVPRLYKDASRILKSVHAGGSLKDLVYNHNRFANIKALHALVAESVKYDGVLSRVLDSTNILKLERFDPWLAKVLLTELIFGKKSLPGKSKPVLTILKYKENVEKHLNEADIHNISSYSREKNKGVKPRYVRVNTLKISLEDAICKFKYEGWEELQCPSNYDEYLQLVRKHFFNEEYVFVQDYHVKNLLVFPSAVQFYDHPAYLQRCIILQDKASCLLTCCVSIKPGSVILDMCAAPGMKTALLAACINNQGKIYAIENSLNRYNIMKNLLQEFGVDCVEAKSCDAGSIGPNCCKDVKFILVDPSCSGTGMTSRIEDTEMSMTPVNNFNKWRLQRLANLQGYLLRHALSNFPTAKYVFYSTCSLQEEENEMVVESVLGCAKLNGYTLLNLKKKINGWKNFGSDKYESGRKCIYCRVDSDLTNGGFLAIFKRKLKNCSLEKFRNEENFIKNEEPFKEKKLNLSEQFFALVNALKISVDDAIQFFVDNEWKHLPSPSNYNIFLSGLEEDKKRVEEKFFEQDFHVKELLIFPMGIVNDVTKNFINEGKFILLDKVSCLAVHLLDPLPGSKVLDMCAGAEKMSLFIASRMNDNGSVYAYETNNYFYQELIKELRRCCITCVDVKCDSGFYASSSDCLNVKLIMVSPPCSGSGSGLAEKTQYSLIKNTGSENKEYILRNYIVSQFSLLRHAFTEFPDAYRIVYVTRSVHAEENEDIINALLVLAKFNGYKLIDAPSRIDGWINECSTKYIWGKKCLITRDETSITKGFFVAVFERNFKNENLTSESNVDDSLFNDEGNYNNCLEMTDNDLKNSAEQNYEGNYNIIKYKSLSNKGRINMEGIDTGKSTKNESFFDILSNSFNEFSENHERSENVLNEHSLLIQKDFMNKSNLIINKNPKKHKRKNENKVKADEKGLLLETTQKEPSNESIHVFNYQNIQSHSNLSTESYTSEKVSRNSTEKLTRKNLTKSLNQQGDVVNLSVSNKKCERQKRKYIDKANVMESDVILETNHEHKNKRMVSEDLHDNIPNEDVKLRRKMKKQKKDHKTIEDSSDNLVVKSYDTDLRDIETNKNMINESEVVLPEEVSPKSRKDNIGSKKQKKKKKDNWLDLEAIFSTKSGETKKHEKKCIRDVNINSKNNVHSELNNFENLFANELNEDFETSTKSNEHELFQKRKKKKV